ncbi:MAG: ferrous iron transporter B, partial [Peptococcaceae bacterium]|nr:ferrous iron transporter B [Peptococcaceae bacterium]
ILKVCPNVLICLNFLEEAEKKHIHIDLNSLEAQLGVPVLALDAKNKNSKQVILTKLEQLCQTKQQIYPVENLQDLLAENFIQTAEDICHQAVQLPSQGRMQDFDRKLDNILTSKLIGYPLMLLLLALIFWLTIVGANYPSQLLSHFFGFLQQQLSLILFACHLPLWLHDLLVLGIFQTVTWVVAVMLPPMAIFFPLFNLLEDSGYLPRIAYNLDKPFQACHSCGKQALTMAMGFGCNAAAIVGCRIIQSPRERLLAILTNSFVPCNGRFPTLITLLTLFFVGASSGILSSLSAALLLTAVILCGVTLTFLTTKLLSLTLLKGMTSTFILELPPYRKPQFARVIVHSFFDRTLFVLRRAVTVAVPAGCLIWLAANLTINGTTVLQYCTAILDPFARLIGLDGVILLAFILGLPANEIVLPLIIMTYTAQASLVQMEQPAQLYQLLLANGWTEITALCTILFSLLHWPCATTLLTIKKETGSWKWTAYAALLPTLAGVLICFILSHAITYLG